MTKRYHMCQSVRGPLRNWSGRQWTEATDWITKDDGAKFASGEELEFHFQQLLDDGNEVIRICACNNFDPKRGCQGHPLPEEVVNA